MKRRLYAVCPRCGKRAKIHSHYWNWELDTDIYRIRCECGRSEIPYAESRVLQIDLNDPRMKECHFDLLLPQGWTQDMWDKVSSSIPHW